jgi:transcription elongation factor Elf1
MRKKAKGRRQKTKKGTYSHTKLNCIDCGVLIDSELSAHIEMSKKDLGMPNMLVFCNNCQFKFKNRLRRIWNGFKYLFE